jgi:hypothetical protein
VRRGAGQLLVGDDGKRSVIGVDEAQEGVERPREGARLDPEDPARLVRPPQATGRDLALPAADMGDPLRLIEMMPRVWLLHGDGSADRHYVGRNSPSIRSS